MNNYLILIEQSEGKWESININDFLMLIAQKKLPISSDNGMSDAQNPTDDKEKPEELTNDSEPRYTYAIDYLLRDLKSSGIPYGFDLSKDSFILGYPNLDMPIIVITEMKDNPKDLSVVCYDPDIHVKEGPTTWAQAFDLIFRHWRYFKK